MSSALSELRSLLDQIDTIIRHVPTKANRVAAVTVYLKSLRVGWDQYGNKTVPDALAGWAERVNDKVKDELIDEVERRHAADLIDRAKKIEQLRAIIPGLAARAAIELGETARSLHSEGAADDHL